MQKEEYVTMTNEEVADGIEFGSIVGIGKRTPLGFWKNLQLLMLESLGRSFLVMLTLVPAFLYCYLVAAYWDLLKGEGVTVWEVGAGLVAGYGLVLHWRRTLVHERQYKAERAHIRLLNSQFRWQVEKEEKAREKEQS